MAAGAGVMNPVQVSPSSPVKMLSISTLKLQNKDKQIYQRPLQTRKDQYSF
jgi:hypothetical protein